MKPDDSESPDPGATRHFTDSDRRRGIGESTEISPQNRAGFDSTDDSLEFNGRIETGEPSVPLTNKFGSHERALRNPRDLQTTERNYSILDMVAQGGMGVVYRVWDDILNRELAMKLIRKDKDRTANERSGDVDPHKFARFVREAEITARLDHPGVVPIHEMARDKLGRVFFTMRMIDGQRLDRLFEQTRERGGEWTQTRVLDVIIKICETVAFAHSRRIIHRDLKPENIMVGKFGETYVMDWGLAKYLLESTSGDSSSDSVDVEAATQIDVVPKIAQGKSIEVSSDSETQDGSVLGTAPFMPPEQAAGRISDLDERSDIYSVGAILYQLLTGQAPYVTRGSRYDSRQVLRAVVTGPPESITKINSSVSGELVAICDKAMARNQADRYQTMREMSDDLRAYLENRVVRAHQTGAIVEFKKWFVRNRNTAIASLIAIAVSIIGLLTVVGVQRFANDQLNHANFKILNANRELSDKNNQIQTEILLKQRALDQEVDARRSADMEHQRAEGLLLARESLDAMATNPGLAIRLAIESNLKVPSSAAASALHAGLSIYHEVQVLRSHRDLIRTLDFNRERTQFVTSSFDKTAIVWNVTTGEPLIWLIGHADAVRAARFSPNGMYVATASFDHKGAIWDAKSGKRLITLPHDGPVMSVAFSPDGKLLATGGGDTVIKTWTVPEGRLVSVLEGHKSEVPIVEFSPDGTSILTGGYDRTARVWDLSGKERFALQQHDGGLTDVSFSRDGRWILTVAPDYSHIRFPGQMTNSARSTERRARVWDAATGELVLALDHSSVVESASFSPDGSIIVTGAADGTLRIWSFPTGDLQHVLKIGDRAIHRVAVNPDGRWVAAGTDKGLISIFDIPTGRNVCRLMGHSDDVRNLVFQSSDILVTSSFDLTARVWNLSKVSNQENSKKGDFIGIDAAISPDGRRLIQVAYPSNSIELRTFPEGHWLRSLESDSLLIESKFSPTGKYVGLRDESAVARVFLSEDGEQQLQTGAPSKISHFAFDGPESVVLSEQTTGLVTTWDLTRKCVIRKLSVQENQIHLMSSDGKFLLVRSPTSGDAELWNLESSSRVVALIPLGPPNDTTILFVNGGRRLLSCPNSGLQTPRLWNVDDGQLIAELDGANGNGSFFQSSRDGTSVIVGCVERHSRSWNAQSGKPLAEFSGYEDSSASVVISPHGKRVVTASREKIARLWNGETGQPIGLLTDRREHVSRCLFTPDDKILFTLSENSNSLSIWDSSTAKRLALISGGANPISTIETSPDGKWFVIFSKVGTFSIHPIDPVAFADQIRIPQMTPDEQDLFQVKSAGERMRFRQEWAEQDVKQFFKSASQIEITSRDQAKAIRSIMDARLNEFLVTLPSSASAEERISAISSIQQTVKNQRSFSFPAYTCFGNKYSEHHAFEQAFESFRQALNVQKLVDSDVWMDWAVCGLGGLGYTPSQLLADLPASDHLMAKDLKWLLEQLVAGRTIRINAGGNDFQSTNGDYWHHDCFFRGGYLFGESFGDPKPAQDEILGTNDDLLYQTERWFPREGLPIERSYQIPLPHGRYQVTIHFAEVSFHPPSNRIQDVLAEDQIKIQGYDTLGVGFARADQREFEVQVNDGRLDLEFRGISNNPKVSAIELKRMQE